LAHRLNDLLVSCYTDIKIKQNTYKRFLKISWFNSELRTNISLHRINFSAEIIGYAYLRRKRTDKLRIYRNICSYWDRNKAFFRFDRFDDI